MNPLTSFALIGRSEMLFSVLKDVLEDDSFKISSSVVKSARQTAASLLEWCDKTENKAIISKFMKYVTDKLSEAVKSSSTKRFNKEKIWQRYFTLRSSNEFIQKWKWFLVQAELPATPVLFQHSTDLLFQSIIKETYQVKNSDNPNEDISMTDDEKNVLHYVAGYVCRHLRKKIERSSHPFKEELVKGDSDDDDEDMGTVEEWTNIIDRGGLWHTTYSFFLAIEEEIRHHLPLLQSSGSHKHHHSKSITSSEDVLFHWLITTADFEIEDSDVHEELLTRIVELYVTIRCYAFATVSMEKFKQNHKKSTQRSKPLRTVVQGESK